MIRQFPIKRRSLVPPRVSLRRNVAATLSYDQKWLDKPRQYGCLMVMLPPHLSKTITDWAIENVLDCHLGPGGRELRPHVTVKFGFIDSSPETIEAIRQFLHGRPPLQVKLTELALFTAGYGKWKNDDGDVLYAAVESPDLHRLNAEISAAFPCEDSHPEYRPHVTISYLDPAVAEFYRDQPTPFLPCSLSLDRFLWSGADGRQEWIEPNVLLGGLRNNLSVSFMGGTMPTTFLPSPFVNRKSIVHFSHLIKAQGQPCKQGEAASRTGCVPASGKRGQRRDSEGSGTTPRKRERPEVEVTSSKPDSFHGEFTVGGDNYAYNATARDTGDGPEWHLAFQRFDEHGIPTVKAGGGSVSETLLVMQAVSDLTEKFVEYKSPDNFYFTAASNEPQRVKLYDRIAPKLAESLGYQLERKVGKNKVEYRFVKSTWASITANFDPRSLRDKVRMAKATKNRWKQVKEKLKEGGKAVVESAGKVAITTRNFFRRLSEKVLGKVGTEVAEAVIDATQGTLDSIVMGDDALPEDFAGMVSNVAVNLVPDLVAWTYRLARKKITGVDPRDVKIEKKSLTEEVDLDTVADMLVELQQQYLKDGLEFEPMDKEGCLELLQRELGEQPGERGEKALPYNVKMEERRDQSGRRYCVEKGQGIVPCSGQSSTSEQPKTSPAAPRKIGAEGSPAYRKVTSEVGKQQRREQKEREAAASVEQPTTLPDVEDARDDLISDLNTETPEDRKSIVERMKSAGKDIFTKVRQKLGDIKNDPKEREKAVSAVVDGVMKVVAKVSRTRGVSSFKESAIADKLKAEILERLNDFIESGDVPVDLEDLFTLKSTLRWAPEVGLLLYRYGKLALTGKDPRTEPTRHARKQEELKKRQELRRQKRQKKRDEYRKRKADRRSGRKALSWLNSNLGGALVAPPAVGGRTSLFRSPFAGRKAIVPPYVKSRSNRYALPNEVLNDIDLRQMKDAHRQLVSHYLEAVRRFGVGSQEADVLDARIDNLEVQMDELRERLLNSGKSLSFQVKGGFTGEKKDKIGRRMCYRDGKRVPCPKKEGVTPKKPKQRSVESGKVDVATDATPPTQTQEQIEQKINDLNSEIDRLVRTDLSGQDIEVHYEVHSQLKQKIKERERLKEEKAKAPREPTPEEVRAVHNPETGRQSAVDAIRDTPGARERIKEGKPITEVDLEELAESVHDAWMTRERSLPNGGRSSRRHLMVPYTDLSEEDKEKDRVFVREVVASMRPEKYWDSKEQPFYRPGANPTVDTVVQRQGENGPEVLLIRRKEGTAESGKWALPGGFVETDAKKGEPFKPGKETPEQAALRELTEESGMDLNSIKEQVKPVGTFDTRGRDPRDNAEAWSVSNAFSVNLPHDMANAYVQGRDDADRAEWVPVGELKNRDIAFDHKDILKASGIGAENLDPGFTGIDAQGREWQNGELVSRSGKLKEVPFEHRSQSEKLEVFQQKAKEAREEIPDVEKEIERLTAAIESSRQVGSSIGVRYALESALKKTKAELAQLQADAAEYEQAANEVIRKMRDAPKDTTLTSDRLPSEDEFIDWNESLSDPQISDIERIRERYESGKLSRGGAVNELVEKIPGTSRGMAAEWVRQADIINDVTPEEGIPPEIPTSEEYVDWMESANDNDIRSRYDLAERYQRGELSFDEAANELVRRQPFTDLRMAREFLRQMDDSVRPQSELPKSKPTPNKPKVKPSPFKVRKKPR